RGHVTSLVPCFALSPNGKVLASTCVEWTLRLWDTDTGKELRSLPVEKGSYVTAMTFSPDSKQFAYYHGADQSIPLVDVATAKVIRSFKGHSREVRGLAFTADGATLFSGSSDRTIRAWDVASGKQKRRYGDEQNEITCLALSPDEKTLTYSTYSSDGI